MKTIKIQNLRQSALLGVVVAGLVVSTAACGSNKSDDSSADSAAVVESILGAIDNGVDATFPSVTTVSDAATDAAADAPADAAVVWPAAEEMPQNAPAAAADAAAPVADDQPAAAEAPADDATANVAEAADEAVVEEMDDAPIVEGPVADAIAAAASPANPLGNGSSIALPNLGQVPTPKIVITTFREEGGRITARILIDAKSTDALAAIASVKVSYVTRGANGLWMPISKFGSHLSSAGTGSVWSVDGMNLAKGDSIIITVTNEGGRNTSVTATVNY